MPIADSEADPAALDAFLALAGAEKWRLRVRDLGARTQRGRFAGRAAQQRHALELVLDRLNNPALLAKAGRPERRLLAFVREAAQLAASLEPGPRARLQMLIAEGLEGEGTLTPLFHLLRTAALLRARGFEVRHDGLLHGTSYDMLVRREGALAEVACETLSADEGRPLQRGDWASLVDRVNPELQTWLAAHPGRYILKMTLPEDVSEKNRIGELHGRISAMLAAERRQDASADAVLKLDPLVLAGAQAAGDPQRALPERLRDLFGLDAHLAVTADPTSGSVMVMAARAGRENEIAQAAKRRLAAALRDTLELEGVVRRFLTEPPARAVVAVTCATRQELLALPDAAPEGELRFRNPGHPRAKCQGLEPAIISSN
ncbi:MAG: hypothetical protein MUF65_02670 [Rubritepida sp.]|nr:hypothetical protein [Rubritepida sp.]